MISKTKQGKHENQNNKQQQSISQLADWLFFKLGILAQPNFVVVQTLACGLIVVNNLVYLFAVHLVALMLLERLNNPISPPPEWVRILLDY